MQYKVYFFRESKSKIKRIRETTIFCCIIDKNNHPRIHITIAAQNTNLLGTLAPVVFLLTAAMKFLKISIKQCDFKLVSYFDPDIEKNMILILTLRPKNVIEIDNNSDTMRARSKED